MIPFRSRSRSKDRHKRSKDRRRSKEKSSRRDRSRDRERYLVHSFILKFEPRLDLKRLFTNFSVY